MVRIFQLTDVALKCLLRFLHKKNDQCLRFNQWTHPYNTTCCYLSKRILDNILQFMHRCMDVE